MAVPTLQAQGAINASTNNDVAVTLPAYTTNDIIVLQYFQFQPNTLLPVILGNTITGTGNWYRYDFTGGANSDAPNNDGTTLIESTVNLFNIWWARATSATSLGTTVTITRGGGDTGNDTCAAGRAYVIRGCDPNGSPFDAVPTWSTPSTAANPQLPAVTVLGSERLVVHFMAKTDNTTNPTAATGYTVGTAATTTTGTDGSFQTYRISANASTTAVTPTGGAIPAAGNGTSSYFSVAFRPNNPYRVLVT